MRYRCRRSTYYLFFLIVPIVFYRYYNKTHESSNIQSPFKLLLFKNQTYRTLSPFYKYKSNGPYLNFAYFNVEKRSRVSHIDYRYDIPVSSQWKSDGHLYPIQIAQFGLSHWSRLQLNSELKQSPIYKFEQLQPVRDNECSKWRSLKTNVLLSNSYIHFMISSNCSLHIQFLNNNLELVYSTSLINNFESSIRTILIPIKNFPRQVNRYMLIDIEKATRKKLSIKSDVIEIRVCGQTDAFVNQLIIGNQTLYSERAFYSAAKWLIENQDLKTGCWLSHVQRSFGEHHQYHLRKPWCSAMAQGQAASLLVRLYSISNSNQYLFAIRRAVQPLWSSNISRAYFQNRFIWLEEYPLDSPDHGLFVLNGCLYALIGIIDVQSVDPQIYLSNLIDEMMNSLHSMLPYYVHPRISNWSLYDLSHLTMGTSFNAASYSYHLVHIILLQCLSQLYKSRNASMSEQFNFYARKFLSVISSDKS